MAGRVQHAGSVPRWADRRSHDRSEVTDSAKDTGIQNKIKEGKIYLKRQVDGEVIWIPLTSPATCTFTRSRVVRISQGGEMQKISTGLIR